MLSYKVTRWFLFILSAGVILTIANSVRPSLDEDSFTIALLLPWYGPRELGYLTLNVGIVMFLAGLCAALYSGARHQKKSFVAGLFLWTVLCSGLVDLCAVEPSEYPFIKGNRNLLEVFNVAIVAQLADKFAVIAAIVFGVSVALLGLLVEYLFYTLPKDGESKTVIVPEIKRIANNHEETPGLKRQAITAS